MHRKLRFGPGTWTLPPAGPKLSPQGGYIVLVDLQITGRKKNEHDLLQGRVFFPGTHRRCSRPRGRPPRWGSRKPQLMAGKAIVASGVGRPAQAVAVAAGSSSASAACRGIPVRPCGSRGARQAYPRLSGFAGGAPAEARHPAAAAAGRRPVGSRRPRHRAEQVVLAALTMASL